MNKVLDIICEGFALFMMVFFILPILGYQKIRRGLN